ncbi:expressed unknown protein [Seminavis robusta]|uniref:CRAL-TRIO domain-containing protein n=1 Tax=Seminavis robusta TaxID=568900 RepID=A0A9N8HGU1_9STRA|nr:expressed unknown protein [Seminavis robusta]|eukprot:Sro660_g182930.1 n/a (292) ;mRNA; f:6299-7174
MNDNQPALDDDDGNGNPAPIPHNDHGNNSDSSRMELDQQERRRALDLKEAVEACSDLDNLSDFWYAQVAIVDKDLSLEESLERIHDLQTFRREHDILENLEDAKKSLFLFNQTHRGHIMHFGYSDPHQSYLVTFDLIKFDTHALRLRRGIKNLASGSYYLHHTFSPDFAAIRQGVIFVVECGGYIWKAPGMLTAHLLHNGGIPDAHAIYPFYWKSFKVCNAGVLVNILVSTFRRILPNRLSAKFELGCQTDIRLDQICLVPDEEEALKRLDYNMAEALQMRYQNEATFCLE